MIKLINYCTGALISILCVAFLGCNEPNEQLPNENETKSVPVSDEVAALFDENVAQIGSSIFYEYDDLEKREFVDSCVMINSVEELPKVNYDGTPFDFEYPAIDFDTYTLVIGQVVVNYLGNNYIASKSLVIEQNVTTMNLTAVRELKKGFDYNTDFRPIPICFWGLYPKIDAKSIHMDISYETKYI